MFYGLTIMVLICGFIVVTTIAYYFPWIMWVLYPTNAEKAFGDQIDFRKISFTIREKKWIYLTFYGFSLVTALPFDILIGFTGYWIMEVDPLLPEQIPSAWIALFITMEVVFHLLLFVVMYYRLWKGIKVRMTTKSEAITNFVTLRNQQRTNSDLKFISFSQENFPLFQKQYRRQLQWMEKRFQKRIQKFKNQNWPTEIYYWKLLRIFVSYLTRYSYVTKRFIRETKGDWNFIPDRIDSDLTRSNLTYILTDVKRILINNFFAMENSNN